MKKLKYCNSCGKNKQKTNFSNRTGYQENMLLAFCKPCMQKRTEEWVEKNRERNNAYQREYRREHPQVFYKRKK